MSDRRTSTVADVVRLAVEACDPHSRHPALGRFEQQLEDDEPVTAVENLEERLALASEGADYELDDRAVAVANAGRCTSPRTEEGRTMTGIGMRSSASP